MVRTQNSKGFSFNYVPIILSLSASGTTTLKKMLETLYAQCLFWYSRKGNTDLKGLCSVSGFSKQDESANLFESLLLLLLHLRQLSECKYSQQTQKSQDIWILLGSQRNKTRHLFFRQEEACLEMQGLMEVPKFLGPVPCGLWYLWALQLGLYVDFGFQDSTLLRAAQRRLQSQTRTWNPISTHPFRKGPSGGIILCLENLSTFFSENSIW